MRLFRERVHYMRDREPQAGARDSGQMERALLRLLEANREKPGAGALTGLS
jgi:hypothetical protein